MKRVLFLFAALALVFSAAACGIESRQEPLEYISEALGVDVTSGEILSKDDTHGGFHGDGETVVTVSIPGLALPKNPRWHLLPLHTELSDAVYGSQSTYTSFSSLFDADIPVVENGFWFFQDRHAEAADPTDCTDLHARSSWNFTAAIYDADTGTLYFLEFDT